MSEDRSESHKLYQQDITHEATIPGDNGERSQEKEKLTGQPPFTEQSFCSRLILFKRRVVNRIEKKTSAGICYVFQKLKSQRPQLHGSQLKFYHGIRGFKNWEAVEKKIFGRPRRRWEDNIKIYLREVGYDFRDWINLAQDRNRWRAYVRAAMNLRDPKAIISAASAGMQYGVISSRRVTEKAFNAGGLWKGNQCFPHSSIPLSVSSASLH
ncbi:hypothetical protein ANN_19053 [Periplaneta americana]|uniref:Uncharacterized protein n=1 Tax=Periplaneta americana TaxID=6978 RepID=A0ABQ8SQG4_PERAM|nr:hypothetical protein ANN_19053 [Periplaneta americana]